MPPGILPVTDAMVRAARLRLGREDIEVSVAAPGEYADVEALSRAADPSEMKSVLTAELLAWFLDQNPCGRGFVVVAREASTRAAVGYFMFYPWLLVRRTPGGAEPLPTFLYVHLYVAPAFRRRRVFGAMTSFGLDLVDQLGIRMAYTVPNPRSTPGFLKFGMIQAGLLPFWVRPNVPGWGLVAGAAGRDSGLTVTLREAFPENLPGVDAILPATASVWSPRQLDLLQWRFQRRPDCAYEIRLVHRGARTVGCAVTRRMRIKRFRTLVLCDAWFDEAGPAALRLALDDALSSGGRVDLAIAFGGNASAEYRRALRGAGLVVCPSFIQPQPVAIIGGGVGAPGQRIEPPDVSAWHLTPYDWDVF
jgi:hypothetical protein